MNLKRATEPIFQPTLHGLLITLRPLRVDDFEQLLEAANDPLIWQQHPEPDRWQRVVFQRYFDSAIASKGALVVVDLQSNKIIGCSRYYKYDPTERQVVIGYTFLVRSVWGGKYNRQLKSLMLDHAFQWVDRVLFEVGAENIRSQKALEKIGARFLKKTELPNRNGVPQSYVVYVVER